MSFLIMLVLACVFSAVVSRSLKTEPWLWYGAAFVIDLVYAYSIVYNLPPLALNLLSSFVQRGTFAAALFTVVMYCGVLPERSSLRRTIGSVRGELSLIACILAFAHCLNYLDSYLGVLCRNIGVIGGNQLASLVIALVIFMMLLVLGATSVKAVKRRMRASTWKTVQKSSYVFFGLIYVHEVLILFPAAVKGSGGALLTCIVGGIVFGSYFAFRLVRWKLEGEKECGCESAKETSEGAISAVIEQA